MYKHSGRFLCVFIAILAVFALSGCSGQKDRGVLKLATTTSTDNSGLLGVLLPAFEKKFNVDVHVIAVGTGKALKLGENGDVDVVFVHAPEAEQAFIDAGYGTHYRKVMYNNFVVLGPAGDPAGVLGSESITAAFSRIKNAGAPFVSRGDDSGTHKKELKIWSGVDAGERPSGNWYMETGQGMGATLGVAEEKQAYVLSDMGTFLGYAGELTLVPCYEKGPELLNPYGIMAVNPARYEHVRSELAEKFIDWIVSDESRKIIEGYRVGGEQLFYLYEAGE